MSQKYNVSPTGALKATICVQLLLVSAQFSSPFLELKKTQIDIDNTVIMLEPKTHRLVLCHLMSHLDPISPLTLLQATRRDCSPMPQVTLQWLQGPTWHKIFQKQAFVLSDSKRTIFYNMSRNRIWDSDLDLGLTITQM